MSWVPAAGVHAIETVAVSFVYAEHVTTKSINKLSSDLRDSYGKFKLSKPKPIARLNVEVKLPEGADELNAKTPASRVQTPEIVGWKFGDDNSGNFDGEILTLATDQVQYVSNEYGSWTGLCTRLWFLLSEYLENSTDIAEIKAIKLEYKDRFVFEGPQENANVNEVLNLPGSAFPEGVFKAGLPWHLNRGWFEGNDNGIILLNLNLALGSVSRHDDPDVPLSSVAIATVAEVRLETTLDSVEQLKSELEKLHITSKETVISAITGEAAELVGLTNG